MTKNDDDDETEFDRRFFPQKPARTPPPRSNGHDRPRIAGEDPYGRRAMESELAILALTEEGRRNAQLNISAFNLAQLIPLGRLDYQPTWDALYAEGVGLGLSHREVVNTMTSAFDAGLRVPRIVADLDKPPPATIWEGPVPPRDGDAPEEPLADIGTQYPRVDWKELFTTEVKEEWIVEPLIPARRLVALFSPPKVGKSLLMLELAVQVSRGEWVLGYKPKQRRVLYVDFENDPRGDIKTRLTAMGMSHEDLDNLVYLSFPSLPFLDTSMGGLVLLEIVRHYEVELVVIDTISRAVGGPENDNDTWLGFYKHCGLALKAAGVACIRLDHTGKDETKGMRGGSAKYGDVDAVWSLTTVVKDKTYQLECTANRLPISEKELVIHRESLPKLHHRVDAAGKAATWPAIKDDLIVLLDQKYGTDPCTEPEAQAVFRSASGKGKRKETVLDLLAERDRRHGHAPIERS